MAFLPLAQYPNGRGDGGNRNYVQTPFDSNGTLVYTLTGHTYPGGAVLSRGGEVDNLGPLVGYDEDAGHDIIFIINPTSVTSDDVNYYTGEVTVTAINGATQATMWTTTVDVMGSDGQYYGVPNTHWSYTFTPPSEYDRAEGDYFIGDGPMWIQQPEIAWCLTPSGVHITLINKRIEANGDNLSVTFFEGMIEYPSWQPRGVMRGIEGIGDHEDSATFYGFNVELHAHAITIDLMGDYTTEDTILRRDVFSYAFYDYYTYQYGTGYAHIQGVFFEVTPDPGYIAKAYPITSAIIAGTPVDGGDATPFVANKNSQLNVFEPGDCAMACYGTTPAHPTGVTIDGRDAGYNSFFYNNGLLERSGNVYFTIPMFDTTIARACMLVCYGTTWELSGVNDDVYMITAMNCQYGDYVLGFQNTVDQLAELKRYGGTLTIFDYELNIQTELMTQVGMNLYTENNSNECIIRAGDNIINLYFPGTMDEDEVPCPSQIVFTMSGNSVDQRSDFYYDPINHPGDISNTWNYSSYMVCRPVSAYYLHMKDDEQQYPMYKMYDNVAGNIQELWHLTPTPNYGITASSYTTVYLAGRWLDAASGSTVVSSGPTISHLGKTYLYHIQSNEIRAYGTSPLPEFYAVDNYPANEAMNVAVDTFVTVDFSSALNIDTVDYNNLYMLYQDGTNILYDIISLSGDGIQLTLKPTHHLLHNRKIYVTLPLAGLQGDNLAPLDPRYYWEFNTTGAPDMPTPWPPLTPTGNISNGSDRKPPKYGIQHFYPVQKGGYK